MAYFGFPDIPGVARYIPPAGPVVSSGNYGRLKEQQRAREEMARQFDEEQQRLREKIGRAHV